jgi:hypothetical protein
LESDLSMADLARMIPAGDADSYRRTVLKLKSDGRLRASSEIVLGFTTRDAVGQTVAVTR